jgi:3-isopropylmalate/(R)-2-methylmalate dehydratase small subunit
VCLKIAGIQAIVAKSYARIFYRNSVDGGFFIPFETLDKLLNNITTGDSLTINLEAGKLTNNSSGQTLKLQPLGEVVEIVKAGNIFEYARKTGMI